MSRLSMLMILGVLLVEAGISRAQLPDHSQMKDKEYAQYCIKNLKNGALVVRLNFKTKAINALTQAGNTNGANQIRYVQAEENTVIMWAFTKYLKFCPVYYISFDSTIALQQGKKSGVFLDENLKVDTALSLKADFFLFAEHGMLETNVPADKTQPDQETTQRGLMEDALVLRNKNLDLLKDPFPYYVHWGGWEGRVKKLEKKLQKFYSLNK